MIPACYARDIAPPPPEPSESPLRSPHAWVSTTYFAEGFPYTVVNALADVLFTEMKASLQVIGLTSLFHLPWNLKFLWGPLLDAYGTKRQWMLGLEVLIAAVCVGLGLVTQLGSGVLLAAAGLFIVLAVLSATHDIAIDGYYLEALDEAGQSSFVGYRVAAYRVAMIAVSSGAVLVASGAGWFASFAACGAVVAALFAYHSAYLPHAEVAKRPLRAVGAYLLRPFVLTTLLAGVAIVGGLYTWTRSGGASATFEAIQAESPALADLMNRVGVAGGIALALLAALLGGLAMLPTLRRRLARSDSFYAVAFTSFLDQRHVGRILAFVILFRTGESFLMKMKYPFLKSIGMTLDEYGIANGVIGLIGSILAAVIGGKLIAKDGLRKWIWPFVLGQNVLNLLFMAVGAYAAEAGDPSFAFLAAIITLEQVGAGFGTAVFMVYLMRCARPDHRAGHMAILTALMSVSFTLAGVASGFLADAAGFTSYFGLTFLLTLPGMALIPFIPHLDESPPEPATAPPDR